MFSDFMAITYLVIGAYIGLISTRKNMLFFLVHLEIVYNTILLIFVWSGLRGDDEMAMIYFLVILALIAGEAVVGLVLTIVYYKAGRDINLDNLSMLNG